MITEQDILFDFRSKYGKIIDNYNIKEIDINDDKRMAYLIIEDISETHRCPYCKKRSSFVHHYNERSFYDGSIINNKDFIYIIRKYYYKTYICKNKKCTNKYFTPTNPFFKGKERFTEGYKNVLLFLYNKENKIMQIVYDFDEKRLIDLNRNMVTKIIKNKSYKKDER